ncbi:MAG: hypothetical protein P8Y58_04085 [Novosphingobium sp.]
MVDVAAHELNEATRERIIENRQDKFRPRRVNTPDVPVRTNPPAGTGNGPRRANPAAGRRASTRTRAMAIGVATRAGASLAPGIAAGLRETPEVVSSDAEPALTTLIRRPIEAANGFLPEFELIAPSMEPVSTISPAIIFFETIKISSFLGDYGAGRVIKTYSLFPGEKATITIKNYEKTKEKSSTTVNAGSSILDSVTEEASEDFENSIQSERSQKLTEVEADILNSTSSSHSKQASGSASALWDAAKASGSTSSSGASASTGEWGTRSARETAAKNIASALSKHSTRASSKRNVEVETSVQEETTTTTETVTKTLIKRKIENVNKSRTLNMVFRQMVQEYVSVIHMTDLRFALYDETAGPYATYSIHELDQFLDEYFETDTHAAIRQRVLAEYYFVFDYQDQPQQFLEFSRLEYPAPTVGADPDIVFPESTSYFRTRKDMRSSIPGSAFIEVEGVALAVSKIRMRTDGVVVDAFLGEGDALDDYAQAVQTETVRELSMANDSAGHENALKAIAAQILETGDDAAARRYSVMFPCCLADGAGRAAGADAGAGAPLADGDDDDS